MPLYTFDDQSIGRSTNGNRTVTESLIDRPAGLRGTVWLNLAAQVARLLNQVDGGPERVDVLKLTPDQRVLPKTPKGDLWPDTLNPADPGPIPGHDDSVYRAMLSLDPTVEVERVDPETGKGIERFHLPLHQAKTLIADAPDRYRYANRITAIMASEQDGLYDPETAPDRHADAILAARIAQEKYGRMPPPQVRPNDYDDQGNLRSWQPPEPTQRGPSPGMHPKSMGCPTRPRRYEF